MSTLIPLAALVTEHRAMREVLDSGRSSKTPNEPVLVNPRADMPGRFEIKDGHHRVADAIRNGHTHVAVDVDDVPDDEPYAPPFFDFSQVTKP